MLTASSPGLLTGTQAETVNAGPPSQLVITSNPFTVAQGTSATNSFTIAMEDTYANPATSTSATTVTLKSSSGSGIFSGSSSGSPTVTTVSIPAKTSSVTAYYGDNTIGTPAITASATPSGLTAATQTETILARPSKFVFSTGATTGTASVGHEHRTDHSHRGDSKRYSDDSGGVRGAHLDIGQWDLLQLRRLDSPDITDYSLWPIVGHLLLRRHVRRHPDHHGNHRGLTSASSQLTISPGAMSASR